MLWLIFADMQLKLFRSILFGDRNQDAEPPSSAARARVRNVPDNSQEVPMSHALNLTSLTYKLESQNGTILGTVTIPLHWAEHIQNQGKAELFFSDPSSKYAQHHADGTVMIRQALIYPSDGNYPDALRLVGASLEEFERIPGCSFMPGAAYLRSMVD